MRLRSLCAMLGLTFILILIAFSMPTQALDTNPDDISRHMIVLQYGAFDTRAGEPSISPDLAIATYSADEIGYYIIQFVDTIRLEWRASLVAERIEILGYVPNNALLIRMPEYRRASIARREEVQWMGIFHPAYRIAPWMSAEEEKDFDVLVLTFAGVDLQRVVEQLETLRSKVTFTSQNEYSGIIRTTIKSNAIPEIAAINGVMWIEPWIEPVLLNDVARGIMAVDTTVWGTYHLFGEGQIVAVADTGLDVGTDDQNMSADFRGRIVAAYSRGRANDWSDRCVTVTCTVTMRNPSGHGTHVAGSVLGNGRNSGSNPGNHNYVGSHAGVAPEARLVFQSIMDANGRLGGIPNDLNELFQQAYDDGARIHTNSWGAPENGNYTVRSWHADQFAWNHPDMLLLFAAGNEGVDANPNPDGIVDLGSISAPGSAKNVLTVGATENNRLSGGLNPGASCQTWGACFLYPPGHPRAGTPKFPANPISNDRISNAPDGLAAFSSRGPVDGNRIKPDLVAPGTNIISARSHAPGAGTGWGIHNSDYIYMGGTSMATPLVAGSAALVREHYTKHVAHVPTSALLKALLVNGAVNVAPGQYGTGTTQEIPNTVPNNVIGWGRVDVEKTLFPAASESIGYSDVNNANGLNTGGIRVFRYEIRDVTVPFRATLAWIDHPGLPPVGGALNNDLDMAVRMPDGRVSHPNGLTSFDRNNNVEDVFLPSSNVITGTYVITVTGHNIAHGPQGFALVVRGGQPFRILSPVATAPAYAGPHNQPNKIIIKTSKPARNLTHSDFAVTIGAATARIITSYEGTDEYVLEVLPPQQSANGLFPLTVSAIVDSLRFPRTEPTAVQYADVNNIDVALVIDRSGSMGTVKMNAAKDAAKQFVDLMQYDDMVGVISFDDQIETNFPLTTITRPAAVPPLFSDDMESGTGKWSADALWGLTTASSRSPSHAWTDSPSGNYGNNVNVALRTAAPIPISGVIAIPVLTFWQRYDLESGYDKGYIEISTNGGVSWTQLGDHVTGTNLNWHRIERNLTPYKGQNVLLRFRLQSDSSVTSDGWYIDDVVVGQSTVDVKTQAKSAIDLLTSRGSTSIGGGLQRGQEQLSTRGQANHPWAIVLLSDGLENTAPYVRNVLPTIKASKTAVHTVGLGSDADEALMLDIAAQTGGTYNFAPTPQELAGIYNTIAGAVANRQTLLTVTGVAQQGVTDQKDVVIDSTVSDATFSISWSNSSSTINLVLRKPNGQIVDPTAAANDPNVEYVAGSTYKYYRIIRSTLVSGVWQMRITGGSVVAADEKGGIASPSGENYVARVSAQAALTARFYLDRSNYLTTEPIKFVVTLSDQQPIRSATVQVSAQPPSQAAVAMRSGEWISVNGDTVPDPTKVAEFNAIYAQAATTITLYDDGLHGDGLANDGVYANTFSNTFKPGTWVFSMASSGVSNMGEAFARFAEVSTYIALNPNPRIRQLYLPLITRSQPSATWRASNLTGRTVLDLTSANSTCNTLLAATDAGVYRSLDGGRNWAWTFAPAAAALASGSTQAYEGLAEPAAGMATAVAVCPANASIVYASGWGSGVYRSADGGASWQQRAGGLSDLWIYDLAVAPNNCEVVYAATSSTGVFKTANGGGAWQAANTGLGNVLARSLAIAPNNPGRLYLGTSAGVYRSDNSGASWVATGSLPGVTAWGLAVAPGNADQVYAGLDGVGVYRSANGGSAWDQVVNGLGNVKVRALLMDPLAAATLYAGRDDGGGVYRSLNSGGSWAAFNDGLGSGNIKALWLDGGSCRRLLAGTANGAWYYGP